MKVCLIDMGSNSVHAVFAEIQAGGTFKILGREKEMVRLGDGAWKTGRLSADAMNAALTAVKRVVHLSGARGMERIVAVATAAIRETRNGGILLDRIRDETGLKVKVITGEEEGRLICLAVRNSVDFMGKKGLILDIGGGSAEVILATEKKCFWIESLKLGCNRLSQMFPLSDPPRKDEIEGLEEAITEKLSRTLMRLKAEPADFVIGASGTLQNLAGMILSEKNQVPAESLRQVFLTRDEIKRKYKELTAFTLSELRKIKGLDGRRADMIVHGLAVVICLMRASGLEELMVCDKALREGLLYDTLEKNRKRLQIEQEIPDIRRRSVMTLAATCDADLSHAQQTSRLALMLFDGLKALHGLGTVARELLEYAALLHDIGYHISYDRHHKHAFYLITNADLSGFTPEEIQTIAWTARFHRRSSPKKSQEAFGDLPAGQRGEIRFLSAMLRLADALDHSHFALVKSLAVECRKNQILIRLTAPDEIGWEIYEAENRKELFEKVFERELLFEQRLG